MFQDVDALIQVPEFRRQCLETCHFSYRSSHIHCPFFYVICSKMENLPGEILTRFDKNNTQL